MTASGEQLMTQTPEAKDANLSIIFQGPVFGKTGDPEKNRLTRNSLKSARRWFPHAELILSTWEQFGGDEYTSELDFDHLVLNRDPGSALRKDSPPTFHNVNRQIVGTLNGLRRASRPLAVKIRSEMEFRHAGILAYFGRYRHFDEKYRIFSERVCVSQRTTINPRRLYPLPHHVCDWFYFGLTSDLMNLFDIPLFPEPLYTQWYKTHPKPANDFDPPNFCRYMPEDYLWSEFLKKHKTIHHEYYSHIAPGIIEESERYIANNTVVLPAGQLGAVSQKYSGYAGHCLLKCYTFREWEGMYNQYAGGALPGGRDWELLQYRAAYYINRPFEAVKDFLRPYVLPVLRRLRVRQPRG